MKILDTLLPADFRQSLRGPLRIYYGATLLNAVGNGLTLSFMVVYLHNVRHFTTGFATLLLAGAAVASLAVGPLWGTLVDHVGPWRVALAGFAMNGAVLGWWATVHTHGEAIACGLTMAALGGAQWGPGMVLLARIAGPEQRARAFGMNFMLLNFGIGLGSLVSATIVNLRHPATFTLLYLIDGAVTLVAGAFIIPLRAHGQAVRDEHHDDEARGWGVVIRDRRLVRYVVAALVLMIGGYGSQEAGFSLFVVNDVHLSVHAIGLIFFFNTTTIVLGQLGTLHLVTGKSRTRVLAAVGVLWFLFWVILAVTLAVPAGLAVASLCAAMVVFAIGETMLQPVGQALVNDIAPEHLRGRYNAAAGTTWSLSSVVAPLLTALYFSRGLGNWWPLSTGITALVGSAMMLGLRRRLTPAEDGRELAPAID